MNRERLAQQIRDTMREHLEDEMRNIYFDDLTEAHEGMSSWVSHYDNMVELGDDEIIELYSHLLLKGDINE